MTPLEEKVWAAAYANEFNYYRRLYHDNAGHQYTIDDISGFACAEVADVAVEKLREALTGENAPYLLPVQEAG